MVSRLARARAVTVAVLTVATLAGCMSQQIGDAGPATSIPSPTTTTAHSPTSSPGATPSTGTPVPGAPDSPGTTGAPSVPGDRAGAKALAVRACQTIAPGFAADRVAAAAPLAAEAAAGDSTWRPLASNLDFIRTHPIDPHTGAGPQQTIDDSNAVARDCFTLAGVTVSQD